MPEKNVTCTFTAWVQIVRNNFKRVDLRILNIDGTNPVDIAKDGATPPGKRLLATDELSPPDPSRGYWAYAPTAAVVVSVSEELSRGGSIVKGRAAAVPPPPPPPSNGDDGGGGGGGRQTKPI